VTLLIGSQPNATRRKSTFLAFFVIPSVLLVADLPGGSSIVSWTEAAPVLRVAIPHSPASGATGLEIGLSAGAGAAAPDTRSRRFWKTT
jgi:hypothetical protein